MDNKALYEALAKHLDHNVVGAPVSPTFVEMLEIYFPGIEAEAALKLPFSNQTRPQLKELISEMADSLEDIIASMISHGTVFTEQKTGKERVYRLLPTVVGFSETPYWAGKETPHARRLAPLWLRYFEESFGRELARGKPVMRVVPIETSLAEKSEILPFDTLKEMVAKQSYCAVAHCPCRQIKRYNGSGCDHSLENCLHFGAMGRYIVSQEMGRQITNEEAIKILADADEEGLVHTCENMAGYLSTICNCCGCCCVFLQSVKRGHDALAVSNYLAVVNEDLCVGCGTCEGRCPMGAIIVGEENVARVDANKCIGCGVCTPTCPTDAVRLNLRENTAPPPDPMILLSVRMEGK
jgi:NAD-dependent dihydropyrimidine dehydrogenase PreA subunit